MTITVNRHFSTTLFFPIHCVTITTVDSSTHHTFVVFYGGEFFFQTFIVYIFLIIYFLKNVVLSVRFRIKIDISTHGDLFTRHNYKFIVFIILHAILYSQRKIIITINNNTIFISYTPVLNFFTLFQHLWLRYKLFLNFLNSKLQIIPYIDINTYG